MKKIFFILLTALIAGQLKAQLVANLQLPPVALTLKSQLWSMTLVNSTGQNLRLKVDMTLTDITNNITVMTASSNEFTLASGTRQMQLTDFMPVVYNVVSASYNIDNSPNGFLPVGHFNVCYQFLKITNDYTETLTEECETADIEPLSPPLLVFPEDEAVIEVPRPVFNWIPPAPSNLFSNLSYDLRLVEVSGIQTPADAVQQNIALFAQQSVTSPSLVYPAGMPALDTGKLYAWQVIANNNNSFVAKSDIWVFRVGAFGTDASGFPEAEAFAKLRMDGPSNYFLCKDKLKFHYDNYLNDDTVRCVIYDVNEPATTVYENNNFLLQPGQNFKQIDIKDNQQFSDNHFYLIELINSRKEKWIGKFLCKKED